jgi:hypothetical protein
VAFEANSRQITDIESEARRRALMQGFMRAARFMFRPFIGFAARWRGGSGKGHRSKAPATIMSLQQRIATRRTAKHNRTRKAKGGGQYGYRPIRPNDPPRL